MYIKEIEIDNFKSFANKVTIPFLKGFTVVSGPNGSGKSNIIDSVLFALGLARSNELRSEQGLGDLISNHNKRNEASVRVTIATDDNEHEFSIKRHIKKGKNGTQSNYYYNDKSVTLTQILLELRKYNITPDSYNVIMQGDVTQITKCSALERRRIIDEIAGISDFDTKIKQAGEQIQGVEDSIASANILINELDTRIEELKADREVALKYQKLKDEKTALETKIQSAKYFDVVRSLELVHENILNATKEKKILVEKQKEAESKIKDLELKLSEIRTQLKEQGEEKQLEVKKTAEEKKGEIERKNLASAQAQKTILENKKTIENYQNGIKTQQEKIEEFKKSIELKNSELSELNKELNEKKEALSAIYQEMTGLNASADTHIQRRNALRKQFDDLKDKENTLIREQLPQETKYNNNQEKIKETKEKLETLKNSAKVFNDEKDKLELQIKQLEEETSDCKIIQSKTLEELEDTKAKKEDALFNLQKINRRIADLEANKRAYKSVGALAGVETVLNSHIQGINDTIANLSDVEEEYIDAINVALGGRANYIVADSQDVAHKAIQILKSQGRNRASFIPMDVIKKAPTHMALPKEKGVIDFAINLIDFDDKYIDAFYFALGDTVVVQDMTTMKKLAGKYRVVTLDGDITEKSGLITGGAKKQGANVFDKSQDRELEKHKKLFQQVNQEAQDLTKKIADLERRLNDTRQKASSAYSALTSAKIELKNLINNNNSSSQIIEEGEKLLITLNEENKKLSKELDLMENKLIKINEEQTSVKEELDEVEKLIDEGELKKLKEKTAGIEDEIKTLEKAIMTKENEIERDENQIKFLLTHIQTREDDIKKLNSANVELQKDIEQHQTEIIAIQEVLDKLNKEIEELGKNLIELQGKRDSLQDELVNFKTSKNKITDDFERLAEQEESYKARRKELEPMLESILKEFEAQGIKASELEKIEISLDEINSKISKLQKKMDDLGAVNMRAIEQFDSVMERQAKNKEQVSTLENEKNEIKSRMHGYEKLRKETFLDAYHAINKNFQEIFAKLSDGEGSLVLDNEQDPFSGGMTFRANIRDKQNQKLAGMSGGEKSLTALALVFAIQKYMPSPFYALDEVDMHLDTMNDEKLAEIITNQSKEAQFIVVSLRKPMIDSADRLLGVSQKDKGKTIVKGILNREELVVNE